MDGVDVESGHRMYESDEVSGSQSTILLPSTKWYEGTEWYRTSNERSYM